MNKNRIALIFAGIFLAIALASPIIFFVEEVFAYQSDLANIDPNLADQTQTTNFFNNVIQKHMMALTILVVVEVIAIILCAISLYFALSSSS